MIGQTVSHYKITAKLGEGGMGEVYLATDTNLDRQVAIKFLSSDRSADPEARQRFIHEAKAQAMLNHPNIATFHDVGEAQGQAFLVMEYVDGHPLPHLTRDEKLTLAEILDLIIQVGEGLQAAHEHGVVHRDIKPENVLVTTKRQVKITDFGLAKWKGATTLTKDGTRMGTAYYMSPEQAEGKRVDHRSDLFSLGVMLYELVCRRRPFEGETETAIVYAVVSETPHPLARYCADIPEELQRIVGKCLAKHPDERYQSVADLVADLKLLRQDLMRDQPPRSAAAAQSRVSGPRGTAVSQPRFARWSRAIPWSVAAVAVLLAMWSLLRTGEAPYAPVARYKTYLSAVERQGGFSPGFTLSPDGRKLVYTSPYETTSQLFLRDLDKDDSRPLPGTERGDEPFFSPDGEWVGFFANGELKKLYLNGGKPVTLCQAVGSGRWGEDDTIFFCRAWAEGLWKISADGGNPVQVTKPNRDAGEFGHFLPEILPGGAAVLFTVWRTSLKDVSVDILLRKTGERRALVAGGSGARYVPTGHLVYAQMGALMAAPFDLGELKLGEPRLPVIEEINQQQGYGAARLAFSPGGALVYEKGGAWSARRQFVWISRSGECQPLPGLPSGSYSGFALSPDGRRVAFTKFADGAENIWLFELDGGGRTIQLTFKSGNYNPIWSPDGRWLAFNSYRLGPFSVWRVPADQSGPEECLLAGPYDQGATCWSPDGRSLLYYRDDPITRNDIWRRSIGSDSTSTPLLTESFAESDARLSPDGRLLAYMSDQSGRWEVYVRAYPALGGILWNSTGGGYTPGWSRDGRELYYGLGEKLIVVPIQGESPFRAGAPVVLLEGRYQGLSLAPDGRFLTMRDEKDAIATELVVVVNWFDELKRLVPTGK